MATEPGEQSSAAETRLNRLLILILETAVDVLGYDAATVSTRHGSGDYATVTATDPRFTALDEAQYDSGTGPCLQVMEPNPPVFLQSASEDPDDRWHYFAQKAAHMGVESSLSTHVPLESGEVAASLNMYSMSRRQLSDQHLRAATGFAEQLAAAMQGVGEYRATARLAQGMAEAMRSRAVIEQAKGILMADKHIAAEEAFEELVALSQHSNVKLREVARRLVAERSKPPED